MMVVFPNYAAKRTSGSVLLEASHALLCDPLVARLGTLTVAAPIDRSEIPGAYRELSNHNVRFVSLGAHNKPATKPDRLFSYFPIALRVWRTVRQADFCYIFTPGHVGLIAALCCLALNRRFALYVRGEWRVNTPTMFLWARRVIFRRAEFILCTGSGLTEDTRTLNPRCESVVPMSELLPSRPKSRESYATKSEFRLLFVGALVREKGVYELLDAVAIVRDQGIPSVKLGIVGAGVEREALEAYVNELALKDNVVFHGFVQATEDLAALYDTGDVFCLPTYHEGFPRVIYEAMWFGMPIIVTCVGHIGSLVRDNVNGIFVKVGSAKDLALKIRMLFHDPSLRERLGRHARRSIEGLASSWRTSTHGDQVIRLMYGGEVSVDGG